MPARRECCLGDRENFSAESRTVESGQRASCRCQRVRSFAKAANDVEGTWRFWSMNGAPMKLTRRICARRTCQAVTPKAVAVANLMVIFHQGSALLLALAVQFWSGGAVTSGCSGQSSCHLSDTRLEGCVNSIRHIASRGLRIYDCRAGATCHHS